MQTRFAGAGLILIAIVSASLAGCGPAAPDATGSSPGSTPSASPAISVADARAVLVHYERVNNLANARLNPRLESSVEAPPQLTMDEVGYVLARHNHQSFRPFSYRKPVFYIPSLPVTARRWFAVAATSVSGKQTSQSFLVFAQHNHDGPWKVVASVVAAVGVRLPVALTDAGTASAVPANAPGLAAAPSQLPVLHAELINRQHTSSGFAANRWTSMLIGGIRTLQLAYGKVGWKYRDHWAATGAPVYALRSKNGGAVMFYLLRDQQAAVRTSAGRPLQSGAVIGALTGKNHIVHRYTIVSLDEFVAIIPPRGKGKIVIEGGNVANIAATNS